MDELSDLEIAALPDEALDLYQDWLEMDCNSHSSPPCDKCTHKGHPESIRENYFNTVD